MRTHAENPMFKVIEKNAHGHSHEHMRVDSTMTKAIFLLFLVVVSAFLTIVNPVVMNLVASFWWIPIFGGIVLVIVAAFAPKTAVVIAPVYSVLEGAFLGFITYFFEMIYPGIALQAILLTLGVAVVAFIAYRTGLVKVTKTFMKIVIFSTMAIFLTYMVSLGLSFFGTTIPLIHESGPVGIIFSLVVVAIASLNFILDIHFIEESEKAHAPKYLEWFGAMSLIITLVWLYIEILKLLAKLRDN
ncbi:MAG: Bax inhibitor-1/YccA family membrane protein [Nanoarchaeota archaeon]